MRVIRAILWILGSFLASKIVGNFVYEMLNEPNAGVNLVNAFIPAVFSAVIFSFGIYKAFFDKQKLINLKKKIQTQVATIQQKLIRQKLY